MPGGCVGAASRSGGGAVVRLVVGLRLRWCGLSSTCGCVGAASRSGGSALARLLARVGLRRCGFDSSCAPKGPRPGGWERRRLGFPGCGSHWGRKILRWRVPSADLQPQERMCGWRSTADGGSRGNDASFSWTVPREGRIVRHPNPKRTHDSSFARLRSNAYALVTGSRSRRSILGLPRTNAASCGHPERDPRPETPDQRARQPPGRGPFGDHPQRQPRQRTSKRMPPRGSAPAGRDPPRQRTSRTRPPRQRTSKITNPYANAPPSPAAHTHRRRGRVLEAPDPRRRRSLSRTAGWGRSGRPRPRRRRRRGRRP